MNYKKIDKVWVIVFEKGEKIIESLKKFTNEKNINAGYFNAIGAISSVELAHYNLEKKEYSKKSITRPLEIVNITGNIAFKGTEKIIHSHIVVGTDKMELFGGHLNEATVAATCEIFLIELNEQLNREYSEEIGLNLLKMPPGQVS